MTRKILYEGAKLIKDEEGLRLIAYPDPGTGGDPWTIGYGHTGDDVHKGLTIDRPRAEALFDRDIAHFEVGVADLVPRVTDTQFSALVSFAYNAGLANLRSSTLLEKHNAGDHAGAADEFGKWVHAGKRVLPGLVKRRKAEAALYLKPGKPI